jgi:hypothetical protein
MPTNPNTVAMHVEHTFVANSVPIVAAKVLVLPYPMTE